MTDLHEQIKKETETLAKANRDIRKGEARIARQQELVSELANGGYETRDAERLLELLQHVLLEWEHHRILIQDRLAYLSKK